jgi:high-affinity nickel-transport protein
MDAAEGARTGFGLALLLSAFAFGFRHGIDWDHIAAITDITSSQRSVRTGLKFATLYAAGHGVVVFLIGIVAIVVGDSIPDSVDDAMGRVVGVTLLILGVYVLYALIRYREDFRLRSRWMLVFQSTRQAYRWVSARLGSKTRDVDHEHEHLATEAFHHEGGNGGAVSVQTRTHTHKHTHTDPFMNYGTGTSLAVGALHGVGAETPTQVLIFLAAAGAGGAGAGMATLGVFLIGLFAANSLLAVASASGYLAASRHFAIYASVSVITALASLVLGVSFVLGRDAWLPVFFGG